MKLLIIDVAVHPHRGELRGLTQFLRESIQARSQTAEYEPHRERVGFEGGFCDKLLRTARKPLILKRRDAGAVDQARLEIETGHAH
jgi:hypothetical protein